MNKDIQDLMEECSECLRRQRRQSPVEFVNRKLPREPWDAVAADLFEFNKEQCILVADMYYISYMHIHQVPNTKEAKNHT